MQCPSYEGCHPERSGGSAFCSLMNIGNLLPGATSPTRSTASIPARCSSPPLPRATGNQIASFRRPPDPQNAYSAKHSPLPAQFPSTPNHASSQSQSHAASATPESILPPQFAGLSNSSPQAIHRTKTPGAQFHSPRQTLSGYAKSPYKNSTAPLAANRCFESACQCAARSTAVAFLE